MKTFAVLFILIFNVSFLGADDALQKKLNLWLTQKEPSAKAKELLEIYRVKNSKAVLQQRGSPKPPSVEEGHLKAEYIEAWQEIFIGSINQDLVDYYKGIDEVGWKISGRLTISPAISRLINEKNTLECIHYFIKKRLLTSIKEFGATPDIETLLGLFNCKTEHFIWLNKIFKTFEEYDKNHNNTAWVDIARLKLFERIVRPLTDSDGKIINSEVVKRKYYYIDLENMKAHEKWVEGIKDFLAKAKEKSSEEDYKLSEQFLAFLNSIIEYKREILIAEDQKPENKDEQPPNKEEKKPVDQPDNKK